jgi:hypothetical protein
MRERGVETVRCSMQANDSVMGRHSPTNLTHLTLQQEVRRVLL